MVAKVRVEGRAKAPRRVRDRESIVCGGFRRLSRGEGTLSLGEEFGDGVVKVVLSSLRARV